MVTAFLDAVQSQLKISLMHTGMLLSLGWQIALPTPMKCMRVAFLSSLGAFSCL